MRHNFSNIHSVRIDSGGPNTVTSTIDVADVPGHIRDVNVMLDIDHTWTNDLRIQLEAPDGTRVLLVSGAGGSGNHFRRTSFDDAALIPIAGASVPFRGTFRPEESLAKFNDLEANGTWTLIVEDQAFRDGGSLNRWSFSIETCSYCFDNNTPVTIDPGPANVATSQIEAIGLGGLVVDKVTVMLDIDHTWDEDLKITLTGPEGTTVVLVDREGGSDDNFDHTTFDDDADTSITEATAPFRGVFRPEQPLAAFQEHLANGTWTLEIQDQASRDGGTLNRWELHLETRAAQPRVDSQFSIDVRFVGGLTANQRSVFQLAAARWSEIIVGDLPSVILEGEEIDDVLIFAEGKDIDDEGGILGQAGPRLVRPGSQLPVVGEMSFDSADLADLEEDGSLIDVIIHEMGHVLGIGTLWESMNLIEGSGGDDPVFTGQNTTREYSTLRGATQPERVPIANTGGPGTREGHWRESTFDNELMTGFIDQGENPLSRMTIACLQDMGYVVNPDVADPYQLPGPSVAAALVGVRHTCRTTCPKIEVSAAPALVKEGGGPTPQP